MNIDVLARIAIYNGKGYPVSVEAVDPRLIDTVSECVDTIAEIAACSANVDDAFIVMGLQYRSIVSHTMDGTEYDDDFFPMDYWVLQHNYKEFWRERLAEELTEGGRRFGTVDELLQPDQDTYFGQFSLTEDVEAWESLYDEELTLPEAYQSRENYELAILGRTFKIVDNRFFEGE